MNNNGSLVAILLFERIEFLDAIASLASGVKDSWSVFCRIS